jgi:hypothetical protein
VELIYPATALVNGSGKAAVTLVYDSGDPWAVTLLVAGHAWLFARDVLAAGLYEPAGAGDVHIRPDIGGVLGHILVTLSSPTGTAALALPRGTVEKLLEAAEALVPPGCERIDWAAEWPRLVGGTAA